jgi:hypothetical protein
MKSLKRFGNNNANMTGFLLLSNDIIIQWYQIRTCIYTALGLRFHPEHTGNDHLTSIQTRIRIIFLYVDHRASIQTYLLFGFTTN